MATTEELLAPVIAAAKIAAAKAGLQWFEAHETAIVAWAKPLADADAKEVMDALAAHITLNGFASVMEAPARNAVTGTETTVANIINSSIDGAAAWADGWLKQIASGTAPAA
jgi:2'-5' RNA ligase